MPTEKSQSIENLMEKLSGISRKDAQTKRICTWCKEPLTPFRNKLSIKEYQISGMCQNCQDAIWECPESDDLF